MTHVDPVILELARMSRTYERLTPDGVRHIFTFRDDIFHAEAPGHKEPDEIDLSDDVGDDDDEGRSESLAFAGMFFLDDCNGVEYKGASIALSPKQFKILRFIDRNNGSVNTCDVITTCWANEKTPKDGTLRSTICQLDNRLHKLKLGKNLTTRDGKIFFE